jgi:hypothetical protein
MPGRWARGAAGAALLLGLAAWTAAARGPVRAGGVVVAPREVQISHLGDGVLRWRELDGALPGGPALVAERVVEAPRGEALGFALADGLAPGAEVGEGAPLLRVGAPALSAAVAARQAEVAEAEATLAVLEAGARVGDRVAAEAEVHVAEAQLAQARALAENARRLRDQGAAPAFEAELAALTAGVADAARRSARARATQARQEPLEVELEAARRRVDVTRALVAEAQARVATTELTAPFPGVVARPGGDMLLSLRAAGAPLVQVALSEHQRARVEVGDAARFHPRSGGPAVPGRVVAVASEAAVMGVRVVVWATVALDAPAPVGATGEVELRGGGPA